MKICFLSADRGISLVKHNGAAAHVRSLVRTFVSLGHEVTLLTPSAGAGDLDAPLVRIPSPQILDSLLTDTRNEGAANPKVAERENKRMAHALGHIWNNVMVEQSLGSFISQNHPDLVFEVYSPYGIAGGSLAKQMGIRHILNVHAPLAWEGKQYRQQALQEAADALEQVAFHYAQLIVTNSQEMRQQLIAAGVPGGKIEVVPNGVDVEMFSANGVAHREGLEGKFVIGFIGSLKAWHGVDILMDAFVNLTEDSRTHLLIVGDGPMVKPLQKLSENFPGRITLTGAIPQHEVPAYVRAMDVAVAPYPPMDNFYFSPLKVLEYMAAGRPIVASNIGQIVELIRHEDTGLLVPPGDRDQLQASILRLISDADLRSRIGANALAAAQRYHTWAQRASEIIHLAEAMK